MIITYSLLLYDSMLVGVKVSQFIPVDPNVQSSSLEHLYTRERAALTQIIHRLHVQITHRLHVQITHRLHTDHTQIAHRLLHTV